MKVTDKEAKALSGSDIMKLLNGSTKIIKYSDLENVYDLNTLLFGFNTCVILIMSKANYGHWVCLTRNGNTIEFFDSYGYPPDDPIYFKNTSKYFRKINNQDYPHLTWLLIRAADEYDIDYNELILQKTDPSISTCGRHVVCRIRNKRLNNYQHYDYLSSINKDLDYVVTLLTHNI